MVAREEIRPVNGREKEAIVRIMKNGSLSTKQPAIVNYIQPYSHSSKVIWDPNLYDQIEYKRSNSSHPFPFLEYLDAR